MEFVLLGLLLLSFPVIAIVALVKSINAGDRLRTMEARFQALEARLAGAPDAAPIRTPSPAAPSPAEPPPAPAAAPVDTIKVEPARAPEPTPEPAPAAAAPPPPPPPAADNQPAQSFEEKFGTRWTVWIGGVALALGGIFLVKYSIEAGLIGPGLRLFFGGLLAAALVAAGEWTRRNELVSGFAGVSVAHIPSILTAAGTTCAYATVYAAYGLYGFLNPAVAFVLLGIVALATLAAALLHGPALAALGLVGAFVTPLLISTGTPNYWALYIYIAVVTSAAFGLARMRMWLWLAVTAVAFGLFWTLPGMQNTHVDGLAAHLFHVIAGFALVAALIVSGFLYGPDAAPGEIDPVSSATLSAYLLGALLITLAARHDAAALIVFTLMIVATLGIAWRTDAAGGTIPVAAVFAAVVVLRWALAPEPGQLIAPAGPAGEAAPQPAQFATGPHLVLGFGFAILFGALGYLAQIRERAEERCQATAVLWSGCGVLVPLLMLVALYYRIAGFERSIPFAGLALLLAAINGFAAEQLSKREQTKTIITAGALHATGTVAALALALTMSLEKGWLTVALALMVPGIAWIANARPVPLLRALAAAATVLVIARVGWEPRIVGSSVGTTPIFNWILYGYGIPAVAFWVAGHLLRKGADDKPTRMVEAAAILFTVLTLFLEIRHYMHGGDIYKQASRLGELALQVCAGLATTIGLEHVRHRTQSVVHDVGALIIAALTAAGVVLGLWMTVNPWITGESVGGTFFNLILLGYGIPAVLAIWLAMVTRGTRPEAYRITAAAFAVLLMLSYLTLEVRTLYQGPVLSRGGMSNAEQYIYSVVWLAYGVALLLFGIVFRSQPARFASALITLLTIGKVFLLDMAGLTGIYRALSFIGLGLVLVGIGWLYQRLLFPPRPTATAASGVTGPPPPG
ncbi:MAG: DUF2339 domain-containing protein [Xanthobacteraceae bacterium]|nr:DUF2339 domain-containing protein [Xanthobacteraceae bacterium]